VQTVASQDADRLSHGGQEQHRFWAVELQDRDGSELGRNTASVPERDDSTRERYAVVHVSSVGTTCSSARSKPSSSPVPEGGDRPVDVGREDAGRRSWSDESSSGR